MSLKSPVRGPLAFCSGVALASILAASCQGTVSFKPWFLDLQIVVPAYVSVAAAFLAGLLVYRGVAPRGADQERPTGAVGVVILFVAILTAAAVRSEALPAAVGLLVLLLGGSAVLAADRAFRLIEQGASLEFESHWGGLGGGLGGWRLSSATSLVLLALLLGIGALVIGLHFSPVATVSPSRTGADVKGTSSRAGSDGAVPRLDTGVASPAPAGR